VRVSLDGKSLPPLRVDGEKMYTVVDDPGRVGGLLHLEFDDSIQIYALTFG
jgi:hypothetical protein